MRVTKRLPYEFCTPHYFSGQCRHSKHGQRSVGALSVLHGMLYVRVGAQLATTPCMATAASSRRLFKCLDGEACERAVEDDQRVVVSSSSRSGPCTR